MDRLCETIHLAGAAEPPQTHSLRLYGQLYSQLPEVRAGKDLAGMKDDAQVWILFEFRFRPAALKLFERPRNRTHGTSMGR